jgi:hypothetical protein
VVLAVLLSQAPEKHAVPCVAAGTWYRTTCPTEKVDSSSCSDCSASPDLAPFNGPPTCNLTKSEMKTIRWSSGSQSVNFSNITGKKGVKFSCGGFPNNWTVQPCWPIFLTPDVSSTDWSQTAWSQELTSDMICSSDLFGPYRSYIDCYDVSPTTRSSSGTCPTQTAYCLGFYETTGYETDYNAYPNPAQGCEPGSEPSGEFFPCCEAISPILIDISGNGFNLTGTNNPVSFDFFGKGIPIFISWTKANSDDAFLVLDRNGNGTIDNGAELFGNITSQPLSPQKNGFLALAEYDKPSNGGNNDGKIKQNDAIFSSLRLWQDVNHNGVSEASELHTLNSLEVRVIDLEFYPSTRQDNHGNWFKYKAKVRDEPGASVGRWAYDVFFVKQ